VRQVVPAAAEAKAASGPASGAQSSEGLEPGGRLAVLADPADQSSVGQ
jgi:hypothetical protein